MEYTLFLDTNALLNLGQKAFDEKFAIAQKTLEEIENIKTSANKDGDVKYKARNISRMLNENKGKYEVVRYSSTIKDIINQFDLQYTPDNEILASAYYYNQTSNVLVVTNDLNCDFISTCIFQLPTKSVEQINIVRNIDEYTGYKDVILTDDEMSYFYTHVKENIYDCLVNEYLIIRKSDGEVVDYRRWTGEEYKPLSYKTINSKLLGKFKPRNPEQTLAFDMLQNKDITIKVLSGSYGVGKDACMIANFLKLIDEGKYQKIVYVRDAIGVKNSTELGFLPGTDYDKMKPFAMLLADHLGGEQGLDLMLMQGTIEIIPLPYMRGRDFKDTIIYCSEAENLTKEHVQLLIGRLGEGSSLWMNGDWKQTDSAIFRMNNGFMTAIQKLAGHRRFGYVKLKKIERSETAAMADLLD